MPRLCVTAFWALLAVFASVLSAQASAAELIGVRFGQTSATATRIVVDVQGSFSFRLSGEDRGKGRLIVDIPAIAAPRSAASPRRAAGLVGSYQYQRRSGGAQLVFDFARTAKIDKAFILNPRDGVTKHRLVIDLAASDKAAFLASLPPRYPEIEDIIQTATAATPEREANKPKPSRKAEKAPAGQARPAVTAPRTQAAAPATLSRPVIVIDPGHGGRDPGATGQGGTVEKDVTLKAALKLREYLQKTGRYRIVMTRDGDQRLAALERATLAREASPDLFISIHADAHKNPKLRGAAVYTVSQKGVDRSAREARQQEDARVGDLELSEVAPDLGNILYGVAQRETISASSKFAAMLITELKGTTPLLNNTHRRGNYRVLLAPDVPAVLLELAFISNKKDEENLKSASWRRKTMAATARAINAYFDDKETQRSALNDVRAADG